MNVYDVFPSNYLRAGDLKGRQYTLTIKSVVMESMGREEEDKCVVYFEGAGKGLVLNRTNAFILAEMYGAEMDAWVGRRITIHPVRITAFGKKQDAIRVKDEVPPPPAPKPAPEPEPLPPAEEMPTDPVDESSDDDVTWDELQGARDESDALPAWNSPVDAQIWAIQVGACQNEHEARNSWLKVVKQLGGFSHRNPEAAYRAFYERQREKLQPTAAAA